MRSTTCRRRWRTQAINAGFDLVKDYFPGLDLDDFHAFADDFALSLAEWGEMVGWGEPTEADVTRFYLKGFGLIFYMAGLLDQPGPDKRRAHIIGQAMKAAGVDKVLDFGAGIGTVSVHLADFGHSVGYVDVGETGTFGRWRLEREAPHISTYEPREAMVSGPWPAIVALDVLEHAWDPVGWLVAFHDALAPGGILVFTRDRFGPHPTHLERTFWLQDGADKVLADIGFQPHRQPDGHFGIGSWRKR